MREITRSVKVALKCLIAVVFVNVNLPYWTWKVEHIVAFTAIFINICTAHAQKRLFMNFQCTFDTAVRFPEADFLLECKISAICDVFRRFLHFMCWMSAIFLLPVCLTYWPRKYTTRVDPTSIGLIPTKFELNDHPVPSYSVFVSLYVTWPCDVDLWPFVLEQLSYIADHVTNPATKLEDPTPIRSWVMSYNVYRWLPLKTRTRRLRMRRITWPVSMGSKTITFLECTIPICLFTV